MPWATVTQTFPRRLHSTQTLCVGILGLRPCSSAASTSSSWSLVDRAAPQLEVDGDVRGDRGRAVERLDVLRVGVDDGAELLDVGEVAQRLDAAAGGARPDGDQAVRGGADLLDPLERRRAW